VDMYMCMCIYLHKHTHTHTHSFKHTCAARMSLLLRPCMCVCAHRWVRAYLSIMSMYTYHAGPQRQAILTDVVIIHLCTILHLQECIGMSPERFMWGRIIMNSTGRSGQSEILMVHVHASSLNFLHSFKNLVASIDTSKVKLDKYYYSTLVDQEDTSAR
jgi:hypothetical protein